MRENDENLYQPKIHSDRIKELYIIAQETSFPMTVLVDFAIRSFVIAYDEKKRMKKLEGDEIASRTENDY